MGYLGVIVIPYLLTIYIHLLTSWDIQVGHEKNGPTFHEIPVFKYGSLLV